MPAASSNKSRQVPFFRRAASMSVVAAMLVTIGCAEPGSHALVPSANAPPDGLPLVIAHRAGAADFPENTILAIDASIRHNVDMIWLTVQLSRDRVPVLYRPADLSTNTESAGSVASKTFIELSQLNAGWRFEYVRADGTKTFPYRSQPQPIPSLRQALTVIPETMPVILDMKALPAKAQAQAVAKTLDELNAWNRVLIYSTDAAYQTAFSAYKRARLFESRDDTRQRLAAGALAGECHAPPEPGSWVAFEYRRNVQLVETFTLGEGLSTVTAKLWTPFAVKCVRSKGAVNIVAIGVNGAEDYHAAACLGVNAVLSDSPRDMTSIRARTVRPLNCATETQAR